MRRFKLTRLVLIALLALSPALATARGVVTSVPRPQATGEETVYITRTGNKYHLENCRTLRKTKIPVKLKDAVKAGYEPCKICHPPTLPQDDQ
jgi:hypothetical protein